MNIHIYCDVTLSAGIWLRFGESVSSTKDKSVVKCFGWNCCLHFQGFTLVLVQQSHRVVAVCMWRPGTFTASIYIWLHYDKLLSAEAQPRKPVQHLMRSLSACCFIELTCLHSRFVLIGRIRDANIIKTLVPNLLVADEMPKSVQKLFMSWWTLLVFYYLTL
jgi:hypothetical protein